MKLKLINELEVLKIRFGNDKQMRRKTILSNKDHYKLLYELLVGLSVIFPTTVLSESSF